MSAATMIRSAREATGLSQQDLADRLGVRQPSVARLEREDADPRISTLERALNAAGYALVLHAMPQAPQLDEGQIRERRALTPAQRLESHTRGSRKMRDFLASARRV